MKLPREVQLFLFALSTVTVICVAESCTPARNMPTGPNVIDTTGNGGGGGGTDTVIVGNGAGCGEITIEPFYITRSTPPKYLRSYYFSGRVRLRLFVREDNLRIGCGHDNQNLQLYLVPDNGGGEIVIRRPGDDCGVLADTAFVGAATRYVGEVTLPPGTYALYARHGSQVDCFTPTGSGNGPVDVKDGQIEFCYE